MQVFKKNSKATNKVIIRLQSSGVWLCLSVSQAGPTIFDKPDAYVFRAETVANINIP